MLSDHRFTNAIKEMELRDNITISLANGATILTTEDGEDIWLEAPHESSIISVHMQVKDKVNLENRQGIWEKCLEVNSDMARMQGGWLCKHNETNTLRLCFTLPKKYVDLEVLTDIFKKITALSKDFEANFLRIV